MESSRRTTEKETERDGRAAGGGERDWRLSRVRRGGRGRTGVGERNPGMSIAFLTEQKQVSQPQTPPPSSVGITPTRPARPDTINTDPRIGEGSTGPFGWQGAWGVGVETNRRGRDGRRCEGCKVGAPSHGGGGGGGGAPARARSSRTRVDLRDGRIDAGVVLCGPEHG